MAMNKHKNLFHRKESSRVESSQVVSVLNNYPACVNRIAFINET